jgi:PBSX family phage terminase large subunit
VSVTIEPLVGKAADAVRLSDARLNIYEGSVRSGKTVASLIAWLIFVRTGPPGNLLMVGKTERTLKRNVIDPLVDMLGPKRARYNQGTGELWLLGRRVYIAGANDERAQDRIRGLTLAGAYVDEVSVLPESFWAMLLTRLSVDGARLFGTSNPDSPNHWLMVGYLKRAARWLRHDGTIVDGDTDALDLHRFSFRLADNPSLSPAYVTALSAEFTGLWRLRFIEGLWVVAEGAIYDGFDPEPGAGHVVHTDDLPTITEWAVAIDYGTTNPFAALLLGAGADDCVYVVAEWRWESKVEHRALTDAQYSARLRTWVADLAEARGEQIVLDRIMVDPSAASFVAQLWADGWDGVRGADNAVSDGIRSVASLLAAHKLKIHTSCTGLLDEIVGYVWDPKASAKGEDKPLKQNDHSCLVAGTMVETPVGEVPIEEVTPGHRVLTRSGWQGVLWAGRTGEQLPVLQVQMSNGRTLTGTGDHPVWVEGKGWVRLDALRYGDILGSCPETSRSSLATGSISGGTPTHHDGQTAATGRQARPTANVVCVDSTRKSGWRLTDQSPPVITSTTSTSIRSTTTWRTLSALARPSTRKRTASARSSKGSSIRPATLLDNVRPSGIAAPKGGPGIASTADAPGRSENPRNGPASSAGHGTRHSRPATPPGSARTPARARGGEPAESTTLNGAASAAGPCTPPTGTTRPGSVGAHVLAVTPCASPADVFNLTIEGAPEFYANGVLVHNCDALRYGISGTRLWWRHLLSVPVTEDA